MADDRKPPSDWTQKTDWMRENGAVEASFSESGKLLSVRLSDHARPSDEDEDQEQHQRETPEAAKKREEDERRRLAFGASARLVKRESST